MVELALDHEEKTVYRAQAGLVTVSGAGDIIIPGYSLTARRQSVDITPPPPVVPAEEVVIDLTSDESDGEADSVATEDLFGRDSDEEGGLQNLLTQDDGYESAGSNDSAVSALPETLPLPLLERHVSRSLGRMHILPMRWKGAPGMSLADLSVIDWGVLKDTLVNIISDRGYYPRGYPQQWDEPHVATSNEQYYQLTGGTLFMNRGALLRLKRMKGRPKLFGQLEHFCYEPR
jgi:hypothetical protein